MLSRLTTLFRSAPPPRPGFPLMSAPLREDVCGVAYHRELTLELAREQSRMRSQFDGVAQGFHENDRPACIGRLHEFDRDLRLYLAFEGVRFESYMRYLLSDDPENLKLMERLRARLRGLAHYVHSIVEMDEDGCLHEHDYQIFGAAIERVGAGLKQVFECQQTLLFPLYRPLSASH